MLMKTKAMGWLDFTRVFWTFCSFLLTGSFQKLEPICVSSETKAKHLKKIRSIKNLNHLCLMVGPR